ncbi:class I SAM-dependent methyltransferase [Pseudomonas capsici]|uniref:class I SAM-dependent methyltransferase n=1 Tax=Pseudomonas capsici TaxID=2810614 RepID=UPI0021F19E55|nr:class I SAM-dependent methyltransferase [Pseudomonas capsici]MCV4340936.1 class I SAM-dependent methyltransferase [Pseudomonas capsici]
MNSAAPIQRLAPNLSGVPETMLMTVWNRAAFSQGPDPLLEDPVLLGLIDRIEYDFRSHFGRPNATHAIRSRYADERVRDFLERHPHGTVVALGEGLETQFWRVDNGRVNWISVDLPEAIDTRRDLLPMHSRNHLLACSALDTKWLEQVAQQSEGPVFVTAAGLLMYFQQAEVLRLLQEMVKTLRQGELFFDCIPPWFSRKTLKGLHLTSNYKTPPMPFGIALGDLHEFVNQVPGLELLEDKTYAEPWPRYMRVLALLSHVPPLRQRFAPGLVHCRFTVVD